MESAKPQPRKERKLALPAIVAIIVVVAAVAGSAGYYFILARPPGQIPAVTFDLTRELMTVGVDASNTKLPEGRAAAYAWDFGDGATATGVKASHTYATPSRYDVALTVTNEGGKKFTAKRAASVAQHTIDTTFYKFFDLPYGDYWDARHSSYGDVLYNRQYPRLNVYPWADDTRTKDISEREDFFVYAPLRMHVVGNNLTAFTIDHPVMFPTLGTAEKRNLPGGTMKIDYTMNYVGNERGAQLARQVSRNNDGFIMEIRGTVRMDYTAAQKLLNMSGDAATWLSGNTDQDQTVNGHLEGAYDDWAVDQGGQFKKFDVFNGFEWFYAPFVTQIGGRVDAAASDGLNITLDLDHVAWGVEVLMSRWFYWGDGCYPDGRCWVVDPSLNGISYTGEVRKPNGWWGQELGWFEDLHFKGTFNDHLNLDLDTNMQYQFKAWAEPGPDGKYGTADDVPVWNWEPALMDYLWADPGRPFSELNPYYSDRPYFNITKTYTHATPGSKMYGQKYQYDYAPVNWNLDVGQTLTFQLPTNSVTFFDPIKSRWNHDKFFQDCPCPPGGTADFVTFNSPMTLYNNGVESLGQWDASQKTLYLVGPLTSPNTTTPLDHGFPIIEFSSAR